MVEERLNCWDIARSAIHIGVDCGSTDVDRDIHAGMDGITQEIPAVQVVNVNCVSVEPPHRPGVKHVEPKPTVLKSSPAIGELRTVHVKGVAAAKTCTEPSFGNAPVARGRLGSSGSLLVLLGGFGLLLSCRMLRLLRRLSLLLVLSLLSLLSWLGLLLMLSGLGLLLLLFGLLLLLMFLRIGGNDGCGKQEQNCCT
jgi:hypothetical protein